MPRASHTLISWLRFEPVTRTSFSWVLRTVILCQPQVSFKASFLDARRWTRPSVSSYAGTSDRPHLYVLACLLHRHTWQTTSLCYKRLYGSLLTWPICQIMSLCKDHLTLLPDHVGVTIVEVQPPPSPVHGHHQSTSRGRAQLAGFEPRTSGKGSDSGQVTAWTLPMSHCASRLDVLHVGLSTDPLESLYKVIFRIWENITCVWH